jgi:serine/threonine-protein kinase
VGLNVVAGELLAGKFRVERVVGRGGMGLVLEATNLQLDQRVALKLLATGADNPQTVERFTREARAAAKLRSEHVARVYDVGRDPAHGPFIVMELLEGKTLAELLQTSGRFQIHHAAEHVIDACEGLAEAHARGIVHQDVKPANLFLATGADGRASIKLLDFGIATIRSKERGAEPTASHSSLGTPAYLAPEQIRNADVDHRADLWALGCVLYELLTGQRPFRAVRFTELVTKIIETAPTPLPADLELPPAISGAIMRCLEKAPQKRFTSTGELALALLPFARRRAHASAAKAVSHVKMSGLDPRLEMPSSMPPPPSASDSDVDLVSSGRIPLGTPRVPSLSSMSTAPTERPPSNDPPAAAAAAAPTAARSRWPIVAGGIAVLAIGTIAFMRCGTKEPSVPALASAEPASANSSATTPVASAAISTAPASEPAPSAPAPPEPASTTTAKTVVRPVALPASARGAPSATSTPRPRASEDSEIRLSR